jgi:NAD(P)-dependent dehydrogenase (short-subunit alcohol dehydrogenase family)
MKNFQQKVAVITGAGSGIGRALAIQLAKDGAKLAICDINEAGMLETKAQCQALGAPVLAHKTNVAKLDEIRQLVTAVIDHYGQADIIINNAGIALGKKPLTELSYEEWEKIMGVNLWGVIYGTKEFLPYLLERPEAAVINISSVFGLAGIAEQTPYCTTKFAVRGFTESLRMELLNTNVEVYCVHPGGIQTGIADYAVEEAQADPLKKKEVEAFKKLLRHTPEKAARTILSAVLNKNQKILIGEEAYLFDITTRLLPVTYSKIMEFGFKQISRM